MEGRIKLEKQSKKVLRMLANGEQCSSLYKDYAFIHAMDELQENGLAKGYWVEGHTLEGAFITPRGERYIRQNPHLYNPVNWQLITFILGVASLVVAIIALFVACTILHRMQ